MGRTAERGKKTVDEIRAAGGNADFIASGLRDAASAREVARRAIELGNGHIDVLINNAGIYPPGMSLYGSSKAAINRLTKTWAAEYGPSGVRVNVVVPGPTRTEGTEAIGEGVDQLAIAKLAAQAPAHRPASAEEIAEAIFFLATDGGSFIYAKLT